MKKILFLILCCNLIFAACSPAPTIVPTAVPPTAAATETQGPVFTLSSPAFANGEPVPATYTCKELSFSPPLTWNEPPAGTKTFAVIIDDPDAGGYTHWVVYNIPATSRGLPEHIANGQEMENGGNQGHSSGTVFGYAGLCPPSKHSYSFRLYALDIVVEKAQGVTKNLLEAAIKNHILAQSELIGTFEQ